MLLATLLGDSAMKTTIDISDPLLSEARQAAARDGVTIRALVEQGLRLALAQRSKPPFKLRDASFKGDGQGLHPDVAHIGWDKIRRLAYDDSQS